MSLFGGYLNGISYPPDEYAMDNVPVNLAEVTAMCQEFQRSAASAVAEAKERGLWGCNETYRMPRFWSRLTPDKLAKCFYLVGVDYYAGEGVGLPAEPHCFGACSLCSKWLNQEVVFDDSAVLTLGGECAGDPIRTVAFFRAIFATGTSIAPPPLSEDCLDMIGSTSVWDGSG